MPDVTVVDGQEQLDALFDEIAKDFYETPMRELMESELDDVESMHRQFFEDEVDPNGHGWEALKPATVKRKGHARILAETGRLGVSLIERGHPDAIHEIVDEPGQAGFSRGTSVEYAGFHQSGTKHLPARPPVGLNETYADAFADRAAEHLVQHLKQGD